MARQKEIVAKRGCTCCGTGCVIPMLAIPAFSLLLSGVVGVLAAIAASGAVTLLAVHAAAYASNHR